VTQAMTCFRRSLSIKESGHALRSVSMLLRQLPGSAVEKSNNITESLDVAKQAIKLDMSDGRSWFVLGNAYLALFFAKMETVDHVKQALKAYVQAEKDKGQATNNPDLHYNRATIHKYQEEYSLAVEGFLLAAVLDPGWAAPKNAAEELRQQLSNVVDLIQNKGKIKSKRVSAALEALKSSTDSANHIPVSELGEGINGGTAVELVILGCLPGENLPQIYVGVDSSDTWVAITLYNTEAAALKVEDKISIPEPYFRNVVVDVPGWGPKLGFPSIRVDNPVTLKVNGTMLGQGKLAKSELRINANSN